MNTDDKVRVVAGDTVQAAMQIDGTMPSALSTSSPASQTHTGEGSESADSCKSSAVSQYCRQTAQREASKKKTMLQQHSAVPLSFFSILTAPLPLGSQTC